VNSRPIASLSSALHDPQLRQRLQRASARLLALDYDGTLAPFQVERMQAAPLPGVLAQLRRIAAGDTRLVLVSGRPIDELLKLLGELPLLMIGSHGSELRRPDGTRENHAADPRQAAGLDLGEQAITRLAHGASWERKLSSVALHTRGMDQSTAKELEDRACREFKSLAVQHGLECRRFNGGVELRTLGRHKGLALQPLIDGLPTDGLAVYIGDDETDEDAFTALGDHGVGIKVGTAGHASIARYALADCAEVLQFLDDWPVR